MEVIVNATVRFTGCIQRNGQTPPCLNNFVNLHRYDTDSQRTQSEVTNTANYQPYLGNLTASQLGSEDKELVSLINSFPRPNSALTYFGIQDVGSYGDIQLIIVYYRVAQGYEQGLVICPNVALPKEGIVTLQTVATVHAKVMQQILLVWNGFVMMMVFVKKIQCVCAVLDISTII